MPSVMTSLRNTRFDIRPEPVQGRLRTASMRNAPRFSPTHSEGQLLSPISHVNEEYHVRPWKVEDKCALLNLLQQDSVQNNMPLNFYVPQTEEDMEEMINNCGWVISCNEQEDVVGAICLTEMSTTTKVATIVFFVHPNYQARGIMKATLKTTCKNLLFCKDGLDLERVEAFVPTNCQSAEWMLQKTGFRNEGVLRRANKHHEAEVVLGLLQSDI